MKRLSLILPLMFVIAPAFAADEAADLRERFKAAYAAAQDGELKLEADDPLRTHILHPYLEAAALRSRLKQSPAAADAGIREFLRAQGDTAVAARLRKPWLASLAERGQWADYLQALPAASKDTEQRCHALTARIALKQPERLREDATALWLVGQDQPDACDPAFDWLRDQGLLSDDLLRARVHLALLENQPQLARRLAERLPASKRQRALIDAARLLENPQGEFAAQLAEGLPADPRLTLTAYLRLARRDSGLALELLEPLLAQLGPEEQMQARTYAAIGLALDHRNEALSLFRESGSTSDPLALDWRLRSALWAGDFAQALEWIDAMSADQKTEVRWRYWRGRALEALGRSAEARSVWTEAMQVREYYGFLAAERLGVPARVAPQPLAASPGVREAVEKNPAMQRARELYRCELMGEASGEYRWLQERLDATHKTEAARQIAGWGWHWQAITTLAALGVWDDVMLRYPLPYADEVRAAAKESGVDLEQIYSVMRQESLFNPAAVSSAGAYGLMQMLPATARNTARRFELPAPSTRSLLEPATILRLGALHLKELLEDFRGQWPLVLAAYNAGPRRANEWLPPADMPADIWIENIPFNETRLYVQRILGHRVLFGWRIHGKPLAMLPLMNNIPPAMDGPVPPEAGAGRQPPVLDEPAP